MTIAHIFQNAVDNGASDIHLIVGESPVIRINGSLKKINTIESLDKKQTEEIIYSLLNSKQKEEFLEKKELDIAYSLNNNSARFRVNLHFEKGNPSLAARIIKNKIPTMEDIQMPEIVYSLSRLNQGLLLLTGPTGCGKSTSLAAIINQINHERSCNIITLEDPIEFIFSPEKSIIRQRQYGFDFLSFPEALKHVVRQDPNVIMVGEMRDLETIATAITIAETGHLVLATLHTSNAAQTIDRIIDIFPPHQQNQIRMQISTCLIAVISQQLIPKNDGTDRIAAREIMINTPAVGNLIRENKVSQLKSVIQTSADDGMISLDQSLKQLIDQELISSETAKFYLTDNRFLK